MTRKTEGRAAYPHHLAITTRWMDNDAYGHVNNVVYYSWFDTVVNRYLIDNGVLDLHGGAVIGLVVSTNCSYFASLAFPDEVLAGLRVVHIGRSSVRYEVGIFRNDDPNPAAAGEFTHVYVDRASGRPTDVPEALRTVLKRIQVMPEAG